jgi:hypothetical protein
MKIDGVGIRSELIPITAQTQTRVIFGPDQYTTG